MLTERHENFERSSIGPQIFQNQRYTCYKKQNSEISIQSEQREIQQQNENQKLISSRNTIPISKIPQNKLNIQENSSNEKKSTKNFFSLLLHKQLVNKFVQNLFQASYILPKKFKYLEQESYISNECKMNQIAKEEQFNQNIFYPGNNVLLFWNIIGILINMISLCCPHSLLHLNIRVLVQFNLNKYTIFQGEIITNRGQIIKHYIKGNGFQDIISLILWIENFVDPIKNDWQDSYQMIQIVLTIKKILTIFDYVFDQLYSKGIYTGLIDLVCLITSVYYFAHIMACAWFYLGEKSGQYYDQSWLKKLNIENESITIQYTYSIYWATTTIVTVGYGDIVPQNYVEIQFTTIMIFISNCVYAYLLNSIGMILKNFLDQKYYFRKTLISINKFMQQNKVEYELQLRARNFLKYQLVEREKQDNQEEMNNLLQKMPESLKEAIDKDIKMKIINQFSCLKMMFSNSVIQKIDKIIDIVYLTPDEILFQQNENSDQSLYYVQEGKIQLYENKSKKVLCYLTEGQKFGEHQFFTGLFPICSAKSENNSIIYKIQRQKLLQIIKYSQKDFQRFHDIKDQILLNQDYSKCLSQCQLCKRHSHHIIDCPLTLYKPSLEQRIKKQNFIEIQNFRKTFVRSKNKYHSLFNFKQNYIRIKQFQEDYQKNLKQLNILNDASVDENPISFEDEIQKGVYVQRPRKISSNKYINYNSLTKFTQQRLSLMTQQQVTKDKQKSQQNLSKSLEHTYFSKTKSYQNISLEGGVDKKQNQRFDLFKEFKYYMPHNNISYQIKWQEKQKINKTKVNHPRLLVISKYSFSNYVKMMGIKMRRAFYKKL